MNANTSGKKFSQILSLDFYPNEYVNLIDRKNNQITEPSIISKIDQKH